MEASGFSFLLLVNGSFDAEAKDFGAVWETGYVALMETGFDALKEKDFCALKEKDFCALVEKDYDASKEKDFFFSRETGCGFSSSKETNCGSCVALNDYFAFSAVLHQASDFFFWSPPLAL